MPRHINLQALAKRMGEIGDNIEHEATKEAMVKTSGQVLANVVVATPVDTGKARSNWRVSIGRATSQDIDTYGPGATASASSIAAGFAILAQYKPGQDVYIQNNVPYIGALNRGHSKQAPPGYIEGAIAKVDGRLLATINWVDP